MPIAALVNGLTNRPWLSLRRIRRGRIPIPSGLGPGLLQEGTALR
jgi:hypothetical protein